LEAAPAAAEAAAFALKGEPSVLKGDPDYLEVATFSLEAETFSLEAAPAREEAAAFAVEAGSIFVKIRLFAVNRCLNSAPFTPAFPLPQSLTATHCLTQTKTVPAPTNYYSFTVRK
jgi:hypothetical protein